MYLQMGQSMDAVKSAQACPVSLQSPETVRELSRAYDIPAVDCTLIALNACGLSTDMSYQRVRFKLSLQSNPEDVFYLGIPVLKKGTPFVLSAERKQLLFGGEAIGTILNAENDTCDSSYFRRNDTALTINTNSRSSCTGCAFCATHRQDATDKDRLLAEEQLSAYVTEVFSDPKKMGATRPHFHSAAPLVRKELDFSALVQLAIVTACFDSESATAEHIRMVHGFFRRHGFNGELRYIGCEVISEPVLKSLKEEIGDLDICLSLECFTRREKLLRKTKSKLTIEDAAHVLGVMKDLGIKGSFTYIVGLDPLEEMEQGLKGLAPVVSAFPTFQVFQPHWESQSALRAPEAGSLEYYLEARKTIESLYGGTGLRPRLWQNYRSLWFLDFAGEHMHDIRV